jgi:hypothetical protein
LVFALSVKTETTENLDRVLNNTNLIVYTTVIRKGQQMPDGSIFRDRQTTHLRVFQQGRDRWEIKSHLISDARDKQSAKH